MQQTPFSYTYLKDKDKDKDKGKVQFNPYQYEPLYKIFDFIEGKFEWKENNLLIADEVGVGKTFEVGIILHEILHHDPNKTILILCPSKLTENWKKTMEQYFDLNFQIYSQSIIQGQFTIVPFSKVIKDLHYDVLIVDEAHYLRNKKSLWKNTKTLIEENARNLRIFMTATPIVNDIKDEYNILELLQVKTSQKEIQRTVTKQREATIYTTLENDLEIFAHIVEYEENSEFRTIYNTIDALNLAPLQEAFFKRITTSSIAMLQKFINNSFNTVNLAEMTEGWIDNEDIEDVGKESLEMLLENIDINHINDKKFDGLLNILSNEPDKSFIIFSTFIATCEYLKQRLEENGYTVLCIIGQNTTVETEHQKSQFEKFINEKREKTVLICSDAAKEGHNLQFCERIIHYDLPFTPASIQQRNGRIYRTGQKGKPRAYYLFIKDSYDEHLFFEIIMRKLKIIEDRASKQLVVNVDLLPINLNELLSTFSMDVDSLPTNIEKPSRLELMQRYDEKIDELINKGFNPEIINRKGGL